MSTRINYARVRRIRSVIYTFLVLLALVPTILAIIFGVQVLSYRSIVGQYEPSQAGAPPGPPALQGPTEESPLFPVPPGSAGPGQPTDPGEPDILEPENPFLLGGLEDLPAPQLEGEGAGQPPVAGAAPPVAVQPQQPEPAPGGTGGGVPIPATGVPIPNTGLPRPGE